VRFVLPTIRVVALVDATTAGDVVLGCEEAEAAGECTTPSLGSGEEPDCVELLRVAYQQNRPAHSVGV
jgi:hypothetical protein